MKRLALVLLLWPLLVSAANVPTGVRVVDVRGIVGQPELDTWLGSLQGTLNRQPAQTPVFVVRTDVDALRFMDDWGSQRALLIAPALWRQLFKPMYRDYVQIAHQHGKKLFMHSDGHITAIYPDLVEIGMDAVNSQLFCMGPENLAPFAGKITFWGEIDRQHLLPDGTPADNEAAVRRVHQHLWRNGGCIAQCEFGPAARPENVRAVFAAWDKLAPAKTRS